MSGFLKFLLLAAIVLGTRMATADPVWDPTEITRLSNQAAQLATSLSTTIETLQSYDRLAKGIGADGARAFTSPVSDSMRRYPGLASTDMPTSGDLQALLDTSASATQLQRTRKIWNDAIQKMASEGLSFSLVAGQDAGAAAARSRSMAAQAGAAQDLRADIQSNSAVCLSVLSELDAITAALAILLEQQASARLMKMTGNGGKA